MTTDRNTPAQPTYTAAPIWEMETKSIIMMKSLFNSPKLYFILGDKPLLPGELSIENHYRRLNYSRELTLLIKTYFIHFTPCCWRWFPGSLVVTDSERELECE